MPRKKSVKITRRSRGPYYFDKAIADAAVEFFPRFLCLVEGEWAGKPFHLSPFQEHDVRQIWGWRRRDNGMRRYRFARLWEPRKNGKTERAAGLGHLLTIGDGEPGAQVYTHALDQKQAALCYDKAARMVALSEPLSSIYTVTKTGMMAEAVMSSFRPLSGEAYGKHGLSPHGNIGDEAHAWKDGKLHTFLIQGMGARRQPLDITISTAGEIKTYGHDLYLASKAILENPELDPETYVSIHEADPTADWTDPKTWAKANPNLGVSLKLDFLKAECRRALANPRLENDFKRYHLNLWVEQATRWFPMHKWDANTADPNQKDLWKQLRERFRGRRGFCALDLGSTSDLTAKSWCFAPEKEGERWTFLQHFYCPEAMIAQRDAPATPYRHWQKIGALTPTPGDVTDYDFIEADVKKDCELFKCEGLAIDRWNATQVSVHLQSEGIPVELFGQGFGSMAAPSKELERLFISGQLEHGNHPISRWMYGNATYRKDAAGNIKPDKERAAEKIDGVVADVMALGLATKQEISRSVYDTRGIRRI